MTGNYDVHVLRVQRLWMINYCYLVVDEITKTAVLIDPAWEANKISQVVLDAQVKIVGILLTHHHPDHINLADNFAKKYQVPVYLSKIEIDFYHFHCKNLIPIEEFSLFKLDGLAIHPYLTPGHTKGGTSYLIGNNFFCGDTLFIEGCGLCTGKGGDPAAMYETLQLFKKILKPDTTIYPGHSYGDPVGQSFSYVKEKNIYLMIDNKDYFVEFRMRPNQRNLFKFK